MPAYSFQKQFVRPVETGAKTHTIRGKRKARPRVGQRFVAFYAMRTKQCRKLLESTITRVQDITIRAERWTTEYRDFHHWIVPVLAIEIDGELLATDEMEQLARRDGFSDLAALARFWPEEKLPLHGDLIHWRSVRAGEGGAQ